MQKASFTLISNGSIMDASAFAKIHERWCDLWTNQTAQNCLV